MTKCIAVLAVTLMSSTLIAGKTNTIVNGSSDWKSPQSYVNSDPAALPGAGDVVLVPVGATARIETREMMECVSAFARVIPAAASSRVVVNVPEGEVWTNSCPMSAMAVDKPDYTSWQIGEFVKTGGGRLVQHTDSERRLVPASGGVYDLCTSVTVAEGSLQLPLNDSSAYNLGVLSVSNSATLFLSGVTINFGGLLGGGMVTNAVTVSDGKVTGPIFYMNRTSTTAFAGTLGGNFRLIVNGNGRLDLLGTASSFPKTSQLSATQGALGVAKFGLIGEESSCGAVESFRLYAADDARLLYVGDGDVTDREFYYAADAATPMSVLSTLDGGPHGGLRLTGKIYQQRNKENLSLYGLLALDGSNPTNECVVDCELPDLVIRSVTWDAGPMAIVKKGAGIWRFTEHPKRYQPGSFLIREGTLRFDSLQEAGSVCSLGLATNLTDCCCRTNFLAEHRVPYAYTLGLSGAPVAPAVFEYTGTNGVLCSTRPIALAGDGVFRNNGDRRIRFRGVSALADGAGTKVFTLDGSGTNFNEVADIADGAGRVALKKSGSGTWVVSGDLTFSGPLVVESGKLVVRKTMPGPYSWYRWTIKQGGSMQYPYIAVSELALFDKDGLVCTKGIAEGQNCAELEPGQVSLQTQMTYADLSTSLGLSSLFNASGDAGWQTEFYPCRSTEKTWMDPKIPESWISVVFRISEEKAGQVSVFDYQNFNAYNIATSVRQSSFEGSVDGLHWTAITTDVVPEAIAGRYQWAYGGSGSGASTSKKHTGGFPFDCLSTRTYSVLENAESVSVAAQAELVADADAPLPINGLVVDAAKGMGRISGFQLAETGTIDVSNVASASYLIPADLSGIEGLDRLSNWQVSENGKVRKGKTVRATAEGLVIDAPGLLLLVK